MATALTHLNDARWLFYERGLQNVHSWLKLLFTTTLQAGGIAGGGTIGAQEVDDTTIFTAAILNTIKPSGNLDLKNSTKLEYGSGVTPVSKDLPGANSTFR